MHTYQILNEYVILQLYRLQIYDMIFSVSFLWSIFLSFPLLWLPRNCSSYLGKVTAQILSLKVYEKRFICKDRDCTKTSLPCTIRTKTTGKPAKNEQNHDSTVVATVQQNGLQEKEKNALFIKMRTVSCVCCLLQYYQVLFWDLKLNSPNSGEI